MRSTRTVRWILAGAAAAAMTVSVSAAAPMAKPEDVGLSSARLERVGELMQREIDAGTFAGAVTLVARHGRVVHLQAQGLMDIASKKPMQTDAVFRIMSMTKPVVAVSILMMMEEGKVRLTDPVGRFIPELQDLRVAASNYEAGGTVAADRPITIRDLLTHTSGLMSGGASSKQNSSVAVRPGEGYSQVLQRLKDVPLDFQPGARWAYSPQYAFDTLVRVVEIVSGKPFDEFAKERLFDPLGMKNTFFYSAKKRSDIATLYRHNDSGALETQPDPGFMNGKYFSGGGGLYSTAEDYLQFASMLLNGGRLGNTRILSRRTVDLMTSVFVPASTPGRSPGEAFGLGVRVVTDSAARNTLVSAGTFGWSGAYNTHFFVDPREDLVAIFMTQVSGLGLRFQVRNDFETAVMQALVDDAPASPRLTGEPAPGDAVAQAGATSR
jgi:CubicO group peptidase (beta-lactamase class C family)